MGSDQGRRKVVGDALASVREALDAPDAEQLDLLPTRFEGDNAVEQRARVVRGRGRPAGAKNIATKEVKDFIRRVIGDPMIESARWMLHTPESMAKELGCTKLEAFDRLEAIRRDLRPYYYGRAAPVDDQGQALPVFQMVVGGQNVAVAAGSLPPWEYQENQEVSEDDPKTSHDDASHETDK